MKMVNHMGEPEQKERKKEREQKNKLNCIWKENNANRFPYLWMAKERERRGISAQLKDIKRKNKIVFTPIYSNLSHGPAMKADYFFFNFVFL